MMEKRDSTIGKRAAGDSGYLDDVVDAASAGFARARKGAEDDRRRDRNPGK